MPKKLANYIYSTVYTLIVMKGNRKDNMIVFLGLSKKQERAVKKKIKESIV